MFTTFSSFTKTYFLIIPFSERCADELRATPGSRASSGGMDEARGQGGQAGDTEDSEDGEQKEPAREQSQEDPAARRQGDR